MRYLIPAATILLLAFAPAYAEVGFSFSGTWGGTLGPITAGDTISGQLTWDETSTTNICPGSATYSICRGLDSLVLDESPDTDGLSITSPTDANVLFAAALYGAGDAFAGIQINDRQASCTTLSLSCFGVFFAGPDSVAFSDFGFDSFIETTSFVSSGPSAAPEPATGALTTALLGLAIWPAARRRLFRAVR